MCVFILTRGKNKGKYCSSGAKYNGYCKRHSKIVRERGVQRPVVQRPVVQGPGVQGPGVPNMQYQQDEPIPIWALAIQDGPIPSWALAIQEEKAQEPLEPMSKTSFIISNTPEEHFGNLLELHGYGKLQSLLKNDNFDNFTCQICFMDDLKPNDIYIFEECNHYYCLECFNHTLKVKVEEKAVDNIICPCDGCDHEITHNEIRCILSNDKDLWQRYDQNLFDLTLVQMDDVRYCPKPGCGAAMCGSKDAPMMTCPSCKLQSCFNCKDEYHVGITCEKHQQWKKENGKGDVKFEKWLGKQKDMKACPKCKVSIQRTSGCNHMSCSNCKYHFHWVTLKKWKGYKNEHNIWQDRINQTNPIILDGGLDQVGNLAVGARNVRVVRGAYPELNIQVIRERMLRGEMPPALRRRLENFFVNNE